MDWILKFYFLTWLILYIVISFTLLLSMYALNEFILSYRSKDLFKYRISNGYYSFFCSFSYISFFIIFLYLWRIYRLNMVLDLKIVYSNLILLFNLLLTISLPILLAILCLFILLLLNLLLIMLNIHKYCIHHIYMIYFYLILDPKTNPINIYSPRDEKKIKLENSKYRTILHTIRTNISRNDLIQAFILHYAHELHNWHKSIYPTETLHPWYSFILSVFFPKSYRQFFTFSPIIFILYDCIFNDFIISKVYYYMLLYVPLIIIRRITTQMANEAYLFMVKIWELYYKKESCIYAISLENKIILENYLVDYFIAYKHMGYIETDIDLDLGFEIKAYYPYVDPSDPQPNQYATKNGFCLIRVSETLFHRVLMDPEDGTKDIYEPYELLVEKIHVQINPNLRDKALVFID